MSTPKLTLTCRMDLFFGLVQELRDLYERYNRGDCVVACFRQNDAGSIITVDPSTRYSPQCRDISLRIRSKVAKLWNVYTGMHILPWKEKTEFRGKLAELYRNNVHMTEHGRCVTQMCEAICVRHQAYAVPTLANHRFVLIPWTGGNTCYIDVVLMALAGQPHVAFDKMVSCESTFVANLLARFKREPGCGYEMHAERAFRCLSGIRSTLRQPDSHADPMVQLAKLRDLLLMSLSRFDPSVYRPGLTGSPGEVVAALPWTPCTLRRAVSKTDQSPVFCVHEITSPLLQENFSSLIGDVVSADAMILVNEAMTKRVLPIIPPVCLAIPVSKPTQLLHLHAVVCATNSDGDEGHYVTFLKCGSIWRIYDDLNPSLFPKLGRFADITTPHVLKGACLYFFQA